MKGLDWRVAMNKVILLGRLTRSPETRYTQNEMCVCRFTLAVNRRFKKEGQPDADFVSIVAFGKTGEFCKKYFSKGQQITVTGRIHTDNYEKDGNKVYTMDVVAEEVGFAEGKKDKDSPDGFAGTVDNADTPWE